MADNETAIETKRITNRSGARQGVNTIEGRVMLAPGQSRDVVVDENQLRRIRRLTFIDIEGERTTDRANQQSAGGNSALEEQLRTAIAESVTLQEELVREREASGPLNERVQLLQQQVDGFAAERTALEERIAALEEDKAQLDSQLGSLVASRDDAVSAMQQLLTKDGSALAGKNLEGLHGKHKGRGSYSIVNAADEEIVEKLTAEQSDAFDAMSPADQLLWVDAQLTPPKQADQQE